MFPSLFLYKNFFYSINLGAELLLTRLYKYSGFLENAKMFTQCLFEYIFLKEIYNSFFPYYYQEYIRLICQYHCGLNLYSDY